MKGNGSDVMYLIMKATRAFSVLCIGHRRNKARPVGTVQNAKLYQKMMVVWLTQKAVFTYKHEFWLSL